MAGIMIFRRILFACFRDHCLAVCHCIPFGFLITKAKLNLSLPTPQRGEVLRTKLQDGLFPAKKGAATFKDVCRPSQLMVLKCHLSLSRESRGNQQPKESIELWVSKERIAAIWDRPSAFGPVTSMNK